jgi:hypothetical protein
MEAQQRPRLRREGSGAVSCHGSPSSDPRDPTGPFADLMAQMRRCKEVSTCPPLTSRRYYFEPNPATAAEWQASGLYLDDIDRRVVFVCESPGPQFASINDSTPSRCWSKTGQDRRFHEAREKYGFAGCYITNSVKCRPPG